MGEFVDLFKGQFTREQVKNYVYGFLEMDVLDYRGKGSGRRYLLNKNAVERSKIAQRAIEIGLEQMRKAGELDLDVSNKKQK